MARNSAGSVSSSKPILQVQELQVYYGESHALQGVSLTLQRGVLSVVGRNGMGKTTLCNTIVGLMRARAGAVRFDGREISAAEPHEIVRASVGFVPQGRRLWPSLSVDETLRLSEEGARPGIRGRSIGSIRHSRDWRSGATAAADSYRAANSKCSRYRALCSAIRGSS